MTETGDKGPASPESPRPGVARTWIGRILQVPLTILVILYFLFDDLVLSWLRPLFDILGRLRLFVRIADWIHGLGPYQSLVLFLVPFIALEPFKIGGLVLLGIGHVVSGTIMLTCSHLLSLLIVERLFHVTRDKLLTIPWFAWGFRIVMGLKDWAFAQLRNTIAWKFVMALLGRLQRVLRPAETMVLRSAHVVYGFFKWLLLELRARAMK